MGRAGRSTRGSWSRGHRSSATGNALAALNAVLFVARSHAYAGKSVELADVLDVAEYLPMLMLEQPDRTDAFRDQLVSLAARRPEFAIAVERFDATA